MTARSIRRAAERKAIKLARKSEKTRSTYLSPPSRQPENAQLSTGPRSEEGKRKSSLNAVKTGLTGVTVLLSTDDAAQYQRHIALYEKELKPVGIEESELVQSLADISWRLQLRRLQEERKQREQANGFEFSNADRKTGTCEYSTGFAESEACPRFAPRFAPKVNSDEIAFAAPHNSHVAYEPDAA